MPPPPPDPPRRHHNEQGGAQELIPGFPKAIPLTFLWGNFLPLLPAGLHGGELIPMRIRWVRGSIDPSPSIHPTPAMGTGAGQECHWQGLWSANQAMVLLLEESHFL